MADDARSAMSTLEGWAESLRTLPTGLQASVEEIRAGIESKIKADIAAGVAPDGTSWKPKKGGGRALVNAAKALSTSVSGMVIFIRLTGVEIFHQFGTHRVPRREMVPGNVGDFQQRLGDFIRRGLSSGLEDWLSRKGRHDKSKSTGKLYARGGK